MGPNEGRRVGKIEVPTDSVPEFELGHTGRSGAGEGGKRKVARGTAREGGSQEGGGQ